MDTTNKGKGNDPHRHECSEKEQERRRDKALKNALRMPPKPHKPKEPTGQKSKDAPDD